MQTALLLVPFAVRAPLAAAGQSSFLPAAIQPDTPFMHKDAGNLSLDDRSKRTAQYRVGTGISDWFDGIC